MDEDLKKVFISPITGFLSFFGLLGIVNTIINKVSDIKIGIIVVLLLGISILILIIFRLYRLHNDQEMDITKLKDNNKGLIEAKDRYLNEYSELQNEVDQLKQYLTICFLTSDVPNNSDEKNQALNLILGGKSNGKKALEDNQNN